MTQPTRTRQGAVIGGPDREYRYQLWRVWDWVKPTLGFVMLNPSTADAHLDDPTLRRCVSRAADEGFGGGVVHNLFAFRAAKPSALWKAIADGVDVVGPANDAFLAGAALESAVIVAGWGATAPADRVAVVLALLSTHTKADVRCLGTTQGGAPRHPLYVSKVQPMIPWPEERTVRP